MSVENKPGNRDLKYFGIIFGVLFTIILYLILPWLLDFKRLEWPIYVSAVFVILGIIYPNSLLYPYIYWSKLGNILGKINTFLILAFIFYFLVLPLKLIFLILRRDAMNENFDKDLISYRIISECNKKDRMEKPF